MSKKQTQNTDQAPEKVVTKYDLKMQRRKEEKESGKERNRGIKRPKSRKIHGKYMAYVVASW